MSLNRREMLRLGAAGAGGVMLSSAASPATLPALVFRAPPIMPAAPIAPPSAPIGVNPQLFARAKAALDSRPWIRSRDFIGVVDFVRASHEPRFHVIHLPSSHVESYRVTHGRGSDPAHCGYLEQFSNEFGSKATSNGAYTTGEYYHGKYGLSMKVHGLDWSNNNAESRAIVIHNAWYAEDDAVAQHGKLGRSEGCFAFSRENQFKIMSRLAGGRMIYADKLVGSASA